MNQPQYITEIASALRGTNELTAANQMILAYRFTLAAARLDGFTMDLDGNVITRDSGYAVAVTKDSFGNIADALETLTRLLEAQPRQGYHLGYWKDSADGRDYIDISYVTEMEEVARSLGRRLHQLAVWDFAAGAEIRLDADMGQD